MALTQVQGGMLAGSTNTTTTIQSNGTTAMTIDSSQNVGIGNTVASTINAVNGVGNLVVGSGSGSEGITIYTGTTDTGGIAFADGTTTTDTYRGYINYAHSTDHMAFWTAATERMRIDSSGRVTTPSQPAFRAGRLSNVSVADQGVVVFDSATTNIGSNYNTSNGRFTAPVAGMYQFNMQVLFASLSNGDQCEMQFRVNGSDNMAFGPRVKYQADYTGWSGYVSTIGTTSVYLNANDYVQVFNISGGTRSVYGSNPAVWSVFSGFLIG